MSDLSELADRYIALWNERDPELRRTLVREIWTEDARYVDPLGQADGQGAIDATIAGAQGQFPGFTFRLGGAVDEHHGVARFTWELAPEGSDEAVVVGFDVAVQSADGRLQQVYGFLDKLPAA
jgi:hypothetical protein